MTGFQPAEFQQFQNQTIQFFCILLYHLPVFADVRIRLRVGKYLFARTINQRQWRTEFMSDVGKEAQLGLIDFFFLFPVQFLNHAVLLPAVLMNYPVNSKNAEQSD